MKPTARINNKQVEADSIEDLERIACETSKEEWIYGCDDQGSFGFCNDQDCNCQKFTRYNAG